MVYWGSGPIDNDLAFNAVGGLIEVIKERMFKSSENVLNKSYPEQSMIAFLQCIRLIAEQNLQCVRVSFDEEDFEKTKVAFGEWYEAVNKKIPSKHRKGLLETAQKEFALFEERVINGSE